MTINTVTLSNLARFGGIILLREKKRGLLLDRAILEKSTDALKYKLIKMFHDGYFNTDNEECVFAQEFYDVVDLITAGIIPLDLKYLDVNNLLEDIEEEILEAIKKNIKVNCTKHCGVKLTNEDVSKIKKVMDFGVMYGACDPYHRDTYEDSYLMNDLSVVKISEVEKIIEDIEDFEKEYEIGEDLKFKIKASINEETLTSYINTSLYTINDELLVHNVALYDIRDLFKGVRFGFDYIKSNDVFKATNLGKGYLLGKEINIYFSIEN